MSVQHIKAATHLYTLKPGVPLEDIKKATAGNYRNEIVVKNDAGTFVLAGDKLNYNKADYKIEKYQFDTYTGKERRDLPKHTVVEFPKVGDTVDFGVVKGQVVHQDFEQPTGTGANWGHGVGGVVGFLGGMAVPMMLVEVGASKAPFIPGSGFGTAMLLGMVGAVAGAAAGATIGGSSVHWVRRSLHDHPQDVKKLEELSVSAAPLASPPDQRSWATKALDFVRD